MRLLEGKTAIVTGGSSGIGRAIACAAARHGARAVLIGDVTQQAKEGGATTAALIEAQGGTARFIRTDIANRAEVAALVAAAEPFGGVDVIACNAGIALTTDGPEISEADLRRLLDVNVAGTLASMQEAAAQMRRRGSGGSIVVTSSMGGLRGAAHTTGYSGTKGAVNLLVASMADGLGPFGIRVNAVCPGIIDTTLVSSSPAVADAVEAMRVRTPLRRIGRPDEIGDVVAWLGSDLSTFVTGVALPVDGGLTATL